MKAFVRMINQLNLNQKQINKQLIHNHQPKSMQPATQLYVREFFNNYLLKKQQQQTITGFNGAVEVLDHLISNFYTSNSAIFISSTIDSESLLNPLPTKQSYQNNINILFENLYKKIQTLLAVWSERQQTSHILDGFDKTRIGNSQTVYQGQQQLYELLNEIKNENKKLKERLKQLQLKSTEKDKRIFQLQQQINQMKREIQKKDNNVTELQDLRETLDQYERQQRIQELQKEQFSKHISEQQQRIFTIKNQFQSLLIKYQQLEKENGALKELQAKIPQLLNKKINELMPDIQNIITTKLKNQVNIQNATLKTVRKVLGNLSNK